MKIGIDISQAVYHGTGVAAYTRELVKNLLLLDRENHYVLFGSTLRRQSGMAEVIRSLPKSGNFTSKIFSLPPTALELIWNKIHTLNIESFIGQIDVFHTSDWTEPPAKARKITTIHDLVVYKYPQFLNQRIVDTQKRKLEWVAKESGAVIADSQSTKDDIVSYLKIPESKIYIVPLGIAEAFFPRSIDQVRRMRKDLGLNKKYILCVGTREPRKNLARVLSAFNRLAAKDTELVIVGNIGWGSDLPQRPNVRILTSISEVDLATIYSGAKCFVYPSLYEGFGLPVLEAMACGVPVVTSNRGSLAEITGKHALVVDPESEESITDGMKQVSEMTQFQKRLLIKGALVHARQFTWKKTAQKTLQIYKSLL